MRTQGFFLLSLLAASVLAVPAAAQVYQETLPPVTNAAAADWQIRGDPVFYAGTFYYPTGPNVFFSGSTMVATGMFRNVPLYEDTTLQPFSRVYVPIGGSMMRPYEQRPPSEYPVAVGTSGAAFQPMNVPEPSEPTFGPPQRLTIQSVPAPTSNRGIFLEYEGARWYSAGPAVPFDAEHFQPAGSYHGFTVYREAHGDPAKIFIPAVEGGPLTPYKR
jgi:hypothetical protein